MFDMCIYLNHASVEKKNWAKSLKYDHIHFLLNIHTNVG